MVLQSAHAEESRPAPAAVETVRMFGPSDVREVHRILLYFQSLADLSREMNPATQIRRTLDSAVAAMAEAFGLKHAMLLAIHDSGGQLLPAAGRGVSLEGRPPLVLSDSARQELLRKPRPIPFRLLPVDCNAWLENAASPSRTADPRSAIPLVTAGELVGLFLFETAGDGNTHAPASNDLLCGMCQNLAVYLYNQIVLSQLTEKRRELEQLAASIKELYRQAVMAFLAAIDIKDGYTKEHSLRVAQMAAVLAQEMHFTAHEVEGMYFAGLLHDIGKILVDREILTKSGALDLTEYAAMSAHTRFGAEILSHIQFPWEHLTHTILHHHDRPAYDEFSPRRPRRNLDLSHKIIGLVDAFDAMSSDRPYRRALPFKACLNELVHGLSVQFDPEITREFLRAMLRDVERPPVQRRLLTDRFVRGDEKIVRHQIADALLRVEQFMGIITAY